MNRPHLCRSPTSWNSEQNTPLLPVGRLYQLLSPTPNDHTRQLFITQRVERQEQNQRHCPRLHDPIILLTNELHERTTAWTQYLPSCFGWEGKKKKGAWGWEAITIYLTQEGINRITLPVEATSRKESHNPTWESKAEKRKTSTGQMCPCLNPFSSLPGKQMTSWSS